MLGRSQKGRGGEITFLLKQVKEQKAAGVSNSLTWGTWALGYFHFPVFSPSIIAALRNL